MVVHRKTIIIKDMAFELQVKKSPIGGALQ